MKKQICMALRVECKDRNYDYASGDVQRLRAENCAGKFTLSDNSSKEIKDVKDTAAQNQGKKFDTDKLRVDLLPINPMRLIAGILTFGAKKYGNRNWEKGLDWSRVYGALLRHLFAWWGGEDNDPETGKSHLAHAGCCIFFLLEYLTSHPELDDRPNTPSTEKKS